MSLLVDAPGRARIESDTSSTLFVEAGAGSGKTHSLVQRICHLDAHDGMTAESEPFAHDARLRLSGSLAADGPG